MLQVSNLDKDTITGGPGKLKIRLPPRSAEPKAKKRKHEDENSDVSDTEDSPVNVKVDKLDASKQLKKPREVPVRNVKEHGQPKKRGRGRPRKAPHIVSRRKEFAVPVFIEIAQAPVLTRGKTPKGDKYMKQPPVTDGPFHLTPKMTWAEFMEQLSEVANIEKENTNSIVGMKWSFQKKSPLPLKDATGFQTMMKQVRGLKEPDTAIIIVALPPTVNRCRNDRETGGIDLEVPENRHNDGTMYGKKVGQRSLTILL